MSEGPPYARRLPARGSPHQEWFASGYRLAQGQRRRSRRFRFQRWGGLSRVAGPCGPIRLGSRGDAPRGHPRGSRAAGTVAARTDFGKTQRHRICNPPRRGPAKLRRQDDGVARVFGGRPGRFRGLLWTIVPRARKDLSRGRTASSSAGPWRPGFLGVTVLGCPRGLYC